MSTAFVLFLILGIFFYKLPSKEQLAVSRHALENIGQPKKPPVLSEENKLAQFRHMKQNYLLSPTWDKKRRAILFRDDYTCQACGCSNNLLSVHHMRDYKLIPNEPLTSLVALCDDCHTLQHKTHGFPQTYQEYMKWDTPLVRNHNKDTYVK